MYKEQPLQLAQLLPKGVSPEDFYVILAGIAAFLCSLAIGNVLIERDGTAARLKSLKERREQLKSGAVATKRRTRGKPEASVNIMRQIVNRFQLLRNTQIQQVERKLVQAGWRSKDALVVFAFFTLVTPIVFGIIGLVLMKMHIWGTADKKMFLNLGTPIAALYFGLKFPLMVVSRKRKKRFYRIQLALADTLDLMTICAEAGLSLAATLDRVSRELVLAYPDMAMELGLTSIEMGFLPDRNKALLNLAERVELQEIRGIVSVLIQTEKYGTPIAQALRVLSTEFRDQRMLRAEDKAARLPAIMTVPMILFILPTLFIIIMTPAVLRISGSM